MKLNLKFLILTILSIIILSSCQNNQSVNKNSNELIIYSPNSEGLVSTIIPLFEQETGIKVSLQQAGTGEIITKIKSETNNQVCDVMWGGNYKTFLDNADLFETYVSANDSNMPSAYQNKTGVKTSYTLDGSCLIVNKDLIGDLKIEGYADLLNPKLKGKIATADPVSSSSAFAHLTNMLLAMGGYDNEEAWKYVEDLFINIDGKIKSSSSSVYKSVVDGEMVVGLSYEDPVMKLIKDGAKNVEIVYMKEGVVYLPAGCAIVKNAKNMENAKKFIDFVISKNAQDALGEVTTNRPVINNAKTSDFMKEYSKINVIEEDYDYVNNNSNKMVEKFKDIFAKINSK